MRRSGAADPKSLQFDVVVIDEAAQADRKSWDLYV
jgi:superfamily I DNA and/or RNA helicase